METLRETAVSIGTGLAALVVVGVISAVLPRSWSSWLSRKRGVLGAVLFSVLAAVAIAIGVAILVTDDHLGAETPMDGYVVGAVMIGLGLVVAGCAYRNSSDR